MDKSHVEGDIFSYENLKDKAQRDIRRLELAEHKREEYVMDYALNAAFSIYHLLIWKNKKDGGPADKREHDLCKESKNSALMLLHSIVSHHKHAKVSIAHYKPSQTITAKTSANIIYRVTEDGDRIVTESGIPMVTEESKMLAKFDGQKAVDILKEALNYFS